MANFAEINFITNEVLRVVVFCNEDVKNNGGEYTEQSEEFVSKKCPNDPLIKEKYNGIYPQTYWKQTSFNTKQGVHTLGGIPKRKNYGIPGYFFDKTRDAFTPPKPFNSWVLDENTCNWNAPIPYPVEDTENGYEWNEETISWKILEI
jgi:hypothetical protein